METDGVAINRYLLDVLHIWVREALILKGMKQAELARLLSERLNRSIDRAAVNKMVKGSRKIAADELLAISELTDHAVPEKNPEWADTIDAYVPFEIEIVGIAGAGPSGEIDFSSSQGNLGIAPMPPGATRSTKAVEVRGTSMRPVANDGWLVYYDEEMRRPIESDMVGMPCVCWLADGRVLIKTPYPAGDGTFNLESYNPSIETIRGVFVENAARVTAIVPRPPVGRQTLSAASAA